MSRESSYREIELEPKLASRAAPALYEQLGRHRDETIVLNAAGVEQIGVLSMQVLIAAARDWPQRDKVFEVVEPSAAFCESAKILGIALGELGVAEGGRD
jgi:anti-anti-sigma regulatory factor